MTENNWIPLANYSQKYSISISTLRRRIKNVQVEFQIFEGRYQLKDVPLIHHNPMPANRPLDDQIASPQKEAHCQLGAVADTFIAEKSILGEGIYLANAEASFGSKKNQHPNKKLNLQPISQVALPGTFENSMQESINKILAELQLAYKSSIQNKEEQIVLLKGEVNNLQTLVKVLESENDRLKVQSSDSSSIDTWLNDLNES